MFIPSSPLSPAGWTLSGGSTLHSDNWVIVKLREQPYQDVSTLLVLPDTPLLFCTFKACLFKWCWAQCSLGQESQL